MPKRHFEGCYPGGSGPRCLGRIAMMDGVAVEAPRGRRCALESDVLAGRVDAPRPALRVLSSQRCYLDLWGSFRLGSRTRGLVPVRVEVSRNAEFVSPWAGAARSAALTN